MRARSPGWPAGAGIERRRAVRNCIGDTEKNLCQLVDRSRGGRRPSAVFDEADGLFGKRSEVEDSRDRYPNLAINQPSRSSPR